MSDRRGKYPRVDPDLIGKPKPVPVKKKRKPRRSPVNSDPRKKYRRRGFPSSSRQLDQSNYARRVRANEYLRVHKPDPRSFGLKKVIDAQGARSFRRQLIKSALAGGVGTSLLIADFSEPLLSKRPDPLNRYPNDGSRWVKTYGDFGPYAGYPVSPLYVGFGQSKTWDAPLTGQSLSPMYTTIGPWAPGTPQAVYGLWYQRVASGVTRYGHHSSYRSGAISDVSNDEGSHAWVENPLPLDAGTGLPHPNPNVVRRSPSVRTDPVELAKKSEADLAEGRDMEPEIEVSVEIGRFIGRPFNDVKPGDEYRPPPPAPPHTRSPPSPYTKESKVYSRARHIGYAIHQWADFVSESADIISAVYDALPDETKRKWSQGRSKRKFVDQFGQYGINGTDWKLQALWHNWHKLDGVQAVKNILANEVEDRIYGKVYAAKDRLVGRGKYRGKPQAAFIDKKRKPFVNHQQRHFQKVSASQ